MRWREAGWLRWVALTGVALVVLLLLLIIVDAALAHNRIHTGVTVSGRYIGGKTKEEAQASLAVELKQAESRAISLVGGKERLPVLPDDVGTVIDLDKSVSAAFALGRGDGPLTDLWHRLSLYVSRTDVPFVARLDQAKMDRVLTKVSTQLDRPPVNATLKVEDGDIGIVEGRGGRLVDRDALEQRLRALLLSARAATVPIPMKDVQPAIHAADTKQAVAQVKLMLSAPVRLTYDDKHWDVSPARIENGIDFRTEAEGAATRLVPFVSAKKAAVVFDQISEAVAVKAANATWTTDGTTASVVPGKTGHDVDRTRTATLLTQAASRTEKRVAQLVVTKTQPRRTTDEAKQMGITTRLGTYTTEFGGSENRRDNVQLAGKKIDLTLLAPGEEFDFDTVVGQRTESNGFKTAPAIIRGKLEDTLGGGICQVATTLFNAVFVSGLEVTSRTNHSLYISHYPKGRDATVSWGGPAFRFRNDTNKWVLIRAASTRGTLTFTLYGTPQGRKVTSTTGDWYDIRPATVEKRLTRDLAPGDRRTISDGQTGRKIKVVRTVTKGGKVIHKDVFLSNYPMQPTIIEVGAPAATTTTKPATTTTTERRSTTTTARRTTTTTTAR